VIAPKLNEPDLEDFPPTLLDDVEFIFADSIGEVLPEALEHAKRNGRPGRGVTPGVVPG
jgi:ATP-dependent Lon protease